MNLAASFRGGFGVLSQCSSCCSTGFQPFVATSCLGFGQTRKSPRKELKLLRIPRLHRVCRNREVVCRATDTQTEPDDNNDKKHGEDKEASADDPASSQNATDLNSKPAVLDEIASTEVENKAQVSFQNGDNLKVKSGSPLPDYIRAWQLDESMSIPKQTIDVLKDQVLGFDTFFVTSQESYEGGVLFKGNLRGQPAKSFEKMKTRMENKFGDQYKLFLLVNQEDEKPVAVVVPKFTLEQETTDITSAGVGEWFVAGSFGLVTLFTSLLRNVPALQSNVLSAFDNPNLLIDGLPGALVIFLVLGVHTLAYIIAANTTGIKLSVPLFVPGWQIGSFGVITKIRNIVPKREDLLKVAVAGPLAGFSLGFVLFLLGFILPPTDGIAVVVDSSVLHESFLVGGIAKLLLGDVLREGTPIFLNPLVIWAWAGLLINAINSIPAGELDGGRIAYTIWGRRASDALTGFCILVLGLSSLFSDLALYWLLLLCLVRGGPIEPLAEEITDPEDKYVALGIVVLVLGLLVYLPYPWPFSDEAMFDL